MLKSVRANPIYLEEWQITEYWKSLLNNVDFLTFQNVRQYNNCDAAKFEKIHRRKVKMLRSLGQNKENMCLSLDEMLPW